MTKVYNLIMIVLIIFCITGCTGGKIGFNEPTAINLVFGLAICGMLFGTISFLSEKDSDKAIRAGTVAGLSLLTALILLA